MSQLCIIGIQSIIGHTKVDVHGLSFKMYASSGILVVRSLFFLAGSSHVLADCLFIETMASNWGTQWPGSVCNWQYVFSTDVSWASGPTLLLCHIQSPLKELSASVADQQLVQELLHVLCFCRVMGGRNPCPCWGESVHSSPC